MSQELREISDLSPGLLKCYVFDGMFPDEYAIEIDVEGTRKLSLFAAKSDLEDVNMKEHTGLLRVKVFKNQPNYVVLPSIALEQGNSIVNVPHGQLQSV